MEAESLNSLKEVMELNGGGFFWMLLKESENYHFFQGMVVSNAANVYFQPDIATIAWSAEYICNSLLNIDGDPYYEFIIDVHLKGSLNEYDKKGVTFSQKPAHFVFTVHALVLKDHLVISPNDIKLLNSEQKIMLLFHKNYERETERLGVKLLFENTYKGDEAYTFFTRIWKLVDQTNPTQVEDTSHHYFDELVECHRNIRYSVAMANVWGRYTTDYVGHSYDFQGGKIYPLNLGYNDYRFIFYLETAVGELYTFYERLAYLLYLFLQPTGLTGTALSFNKLFERKIKRELKQKFPGLTGDLNYKWFENRFSKEHKVLSGFRHPLIHYQTDNTFVKGAYNASVKRIWLENAAGGENELIKLSGDIKGIQKFINKELVSCRDAFERAVLVIEQLDQNLINPAINE